MIALPSEAGIPRCFGVRIQQRFLPMKVLICYYSTYGNVYKMANLVAEGASQVAGADFREAGAIAFGTPTRFGNVSSQLKNQIDQLSALWLKGELEGKPAGVFVSTGSLHGGQETTILTLMAPLLHLGMILVGVPYSVQELFTTQGGGSPTVRVIWLEESTGAKSTRTRRPFAAPWVADWQKLDCGCKRSKAATRTHAKETVPA
jgi:NAD(P)H dehydrogenase (quinone)